MQACGLRQACAAARAAAAKRMCRQAAGARQPSSLPSRPVNLSYRPCLLACLPACLLACLVATVWLLSRKRAGAHRRPGPPRLLPLPRQPRPSLLLAGGRQPGGGGGGVRVGVGGGWGWGGGHKGGTAPSPGAECPLHPTAICVTPAGCWGAHMLCPAAPAGPPPLPPSLRTPPRTPTPIHTAPQTPPTPPLSWTFHVEFMLI